MVPDKFNMVDMEGIDIITSQGEEIPGLYQKLVESIAQCRYQCLYNWKFDGILIPPTYVELVVDSLSGNVLINEGVCVTPEDVIMIIQEEEGVAQAISGTFLGNGTKEVSLSIGFEPDVIIIDSGLATNVAGPVGLYSVAIAKNHFTLNVTHNSTTDTNAVRTIFGQLLNMGWGDNSTIGAYRNTATYQDGILTVTNVTYSPPAQYLFIADQEYSWTAYKYNQ